MWNCYLAVHGVTDKALVGSMAFGAIEKDPECKRLFMDACKRALAMAAENIGAGPITEWHEQKPSEPKGSA